jgi:hypothetical protein
MSDLYGRALTPGLFDLLSSRLSVVVVGTVDSDGCPHTAPYNQVYAPDPNHLRLAINRQDLTFAALRDYGLAMVEVLEEGDLAAGIKGRARVIRDRMESNVNLALVELEIDEVKKDNSPLLLVVQGARTRYRESPFLFQQKPVIMEMRL